MECKYNLTKELKKIYGGIYLTEVECKFDLHKGRQQGSYGYLSNRSGM